MRGRGRFWLRVAYVVGLLIVGCGAVAAQALPGLLPVSEALELSAHVTHQGDVALHWKIAPHYYLYRTQIKVIGSKNVSFGSIKLPPGQKVHDSFFGNVAVYKHAVAVTVPYSLSSNSRHLRFSVSYRGCHDADPVVCFPPHTQSFDLQVPPVGGGSARGVAIGVTGSVIPKASVEVAAAASTTSVHGLRVTERGARGGAVGLLTALLLAFAGGLILNVMPCVLPVLAMKITGLLENGGSSRAGRVHALIYTGGVLATFLAIGGTILLFRSLGYTLGWGTQLQHPVIVGILVCVMVAVGLSMSGVVQFGSNFGNVGHGLAARSGWVGDFFTGVLAVVVASPCVAPFMGAALAYAFVAPTAQGLVTFLALGVGLALPFLLIAFVPGFHRLVPKPGAWMVMVKQVLAFPMYLTAVWLVWVLAHQGGPNAVGLVLVASVVLAAALWWFERARNSGLAMRVAPAILALLAVVPLYLVGELPPPAAAVASNPSSTEVPFSPEKLASLRKEGTPVFINMTADWCITCQANEHTILDTATFRRLLKKTGSIYMVGDWTNQNSKITAFLQKYHSPGVPLYVYFPGNGGAGKVLPTVLTFSLVRNTLVNATTSG